MRIVVAVVGKPRDAALAAAIRDYEARATRYWPLEVREVREESGRSLSAQQVRDRESERLASAAIYVALGESFSSLSAATARESSPLPAQRLGASRRLRPRLGQEVR